MTDFNAWLDGGVSEDQKKKNNITPTSYQQNKTTDFNAWLSTPPKAQKVVTPTIQQTTTPTIQPKKQGLDLGSILGNITNTIKNALVKAIPQLGDQTNIPSTAQPTTDLKSLLDQTKNLPKTTTPVKQLNIDNQQPQPSAQLTDTIRSSPEFMVNQQKVTNIIDSVLKFNPVDTAISKTQDILSKQAEDYTTGKLATPPLVYNLAFYQKLTEPVLQNKYSRAFVRAESKAILGSSQKIQDVFNTKLDQPQNIGDQVAYTGIEMLTGLANLFVGGKGLEAIGVAKNAVLPTLFTILGQLGSPPSTTVQQRLAKAPVDMVTGWLFNLVPGSEKLFSKQTLKGMGLVAGVTAPTSFVSYLVEGLKPKEAAKEALKASVINAAFHSVMVAQGIAGKKLFGEAKTGTTVLTPDQARVQATATDLAGTPAGQDLNNIATKATTEGKNIKIEVVAVKQGAATKVVGAENLKKVGIEVPTIQSEQNGKVVETPNGVSVRYTLVDEQAPIQKLTGETPQPKTTEITKEPQATQEISQKYDLAKYSPSVASFGIQSGNKEFYLLTPKLVDQLKPVDFNSKEMTQSDMHLTAPGTSGDLQGNINRLLEQGYVFKGEMTENQLPEKVKSQITIQPSTEANIEEIKKSNPTLFKQAQKANSVEDFIQKMSNGKIETVDTKVLTDFYNKVKGETSVTFPKLISDYWENKDPTAFTKERLDLAGISKQEVINLLDKAIKVGVDKEFILDRSKYTATKLAIEDIKNEIKIKEGKSLTPEENLRLNKQLNEDIFKQFYKGQQDIEVMKSYGDELMKQIDQKKITVDQALRLFEKKYPKKEYKRGEITKIENELDQLLGTNDFNFSGSWKNKLAARTTAFQQLEYYAGEGDQGAQDALKRANELEAKLEEARTLKRTSTGFADIGGYSDIESMQKTLKNIKAIEFPEMLRIAKELMGGKVPSVALPRFRPTLGGRPLGLFSPTGDGKILLNPDIFKEPNLAARVLAHEMGHLTDYLPEGTMKRGNLLGRIGSMNKFMRELFSDPDTEEVITRLTGQRKSLTEQRRKLKNADGIVIDKATDKKILAEIKDLNKRINNLQQGAIKNSVVKEELIKLTQKWKPFDPTEDEAFTEYRYSPPELYADAISVLYNDPDLLKEIAPTFYQNFFEYMDRKPTVKEAFFEIQKLINQGDSAVSEQRDKEINEMFKKGEDLYKIKREEYKKKQLDFLFKFKYDFIDKNQKLIDYVNKAKKDGKVIPDEDNPQYWLEEYNYLGGVLKNFAETKIQPIYETLNKNDISWSDFGKYLFLDRVINERGKFANPLGYAPDTANSQLDYIKKQLGENKYNIIVEQANLFRDNIKSLLDPAAEAGVYDTAIVKDLKLNPAYATFQVLDYLDDYIPASIKKQIGTLKEIANPADAMVLKAMSLLRATEKNKVKSKMIEFIKRFDPKEIQDAKTRWNGKYNEAIEPKELGQGLFTVMEGGKIKGYYVDEYIAKIFEYAGTGNNNAFLGFMGMLNSKYWRPIFTTFNTGFQSFNIFRDFFRYWKNQPELNILQVLNQYRKAFPHAANRAFGNPDKIVSEMEKSKILSVTMNDLLGGQLAEDEEKQIEFALRKAGLSPTNDQRQGLFKPILKLLDTIESVGNLIESLPKISAYMRYQGEMKPKELGHFIRTEAGSPDFLRKGAGYYGYNNVFLFSNAIKEGFRADYEVAIKNPKTRTGWWFKTFMVNILPKIFMFLAGAGAFGLGLKRMMDKVTEYDKTNYLTIPIGENENGQVVYIRIPQDETGRFVSGLFWKMLNVKNENQSIAKNVTDMFSFMGGQAPNLNPLITAGSAIFQFGIGQNPYDWQKGKNVIPDTAFKAGGKYALIPFVKWLSDQMGGGIIYRFNVTQKSPESQTWVEKIINAPILSNILGRWVRVTDYGVQESLSKQEAQITSQQAQRTIEKKDAIKKYVEMYRKNPDQNFLNLENQLVKEVYQVKGTITTAQKQGMAILRKQFRVAVATGENTYLDSYFYANTNEAKLNVLKEMKANVTDNKFKQTLKNLKAQGLISNEMIIRALK